MKRLGFSLLLSLAVFGSVAAQTGSKHVDLKEITDGKFRQVTAIGEMRSLPDGEHYTAMNADKSMIIKYSYRTGNPVDTLFNARKARECTFTDFDGYNQQHRASYLGLEGYGVYLSSLYQGCGL